MQSRYVFDESEIHLFKKQAHAIRNALLVYKEDQTPPVTRMMDIWAKCLGYPDYQIFIRQTKGHRKSSPEGDSHSPFRLTAQNFLPLTEALSQQIGPHFSTSHCAWALAGLLNLDGQNPLTEEDIELIDKLMVRTAPTPVDERKQRLIDLGCLAVETRAFENAPELGPVIVGYKVTELGKYAAARELERQQAGAPLASLDFVKLGLPYEELCRMRTIGASFTVSWSQGKPISTAVRVDI